MKAFLASVAAAILLAVVAGVILGGSSDSADVYQSAQGTVRL